MLLPGFLRPVSYLQPFQRVEVVLFLLAGLSLALFQYRFHCAASVLSYGRPNTSAQLSIVTPSCRWWFDVQTHRGFCGRSGIRTRDVLRFLRRLSEALSIQRLFQCCLRPLSHPSLILCLAIPSQGLATSVASYRHTLHCVYSPQSPVSRIPTWFLSSFH